jgi:two-component SAPR family response regulator
MVTYEIVAEGFVLGDESWEVLASNVSHVDEAHELAHVWAERCLAEEEYRWAEYVTVRVENVLPSVKIRKWEGHINSDEAGSCDVHSDFMLEGGELDG